MIRVDGSTISSATVEHWTAIQATINGLLPAGQPPAKLDPPRYTACVEHLRGGEAALGQGAQTVTSLRRECKQRVEGARQHVLAILLTYQWLSGESRALHASVSNREVSKQMESYRRSFPSQAAFRSQLKVQGKDVSDELLILKIDLLRSRLEQAVAGRAGEAAARRFLQELPQRWTPRTSCAAGFVVPGCKQYRGPAVPEITT